MNGRNRMMTGIGLGVGLMYFLDPDRGRRRRALVRDKITHTANSTADAIGTTRRHLTHRVGGVVARARGLFRYQLIDDDVLIERVRAQLGRVVSHPHTIHVEAIDGCITLTGAIPEKEERPLL